MHVQYRTTKIIWISVVSAMFGQVKGFGRWFDSANGVFIVMYLPVGASFPEASARALCRLDIGLDVSGIRGIIDRRCKCWFLSMWVFSDI